MRGRGRRATSPRGGDPTDREWREWILRDSRLDVPARPSASSIDGSGGAPHPADVVVVTERGAARPERPMRLAMDRTVGATRARKRLATPLVPSALLGLLGLLALAGIARAVPPIEPQEPTPCPPAGQAVYARVVAMVTAIEQPKGVCKLLTTNATATHSSPTETHGCVYASQHNGPRPCTHDEVTISGSEKQLIYNRVYDRTVEICDIEPGEHDITLCTGFDGDTTTCRVPVIAGRTTAFALQATNPKVTIEVATVLEGPGDLEGQTLTVTLPLRLCTPEKIGGLIVDWSCKHRHWIEPRPYHFYWSESAETPEAHLCPMPTQAQRQPGCSRCSAGGEFTPSPGLLLLAITVGFRLRKRG